MRSIASRRTLGLARTSALTGASFEAICFPQMAPQDVVLAETQLALARKPRPKIVTRRRRGEAREPSGLWRRSRTPGCPPAIAPCRDWRGRGRRPQRSRSCPWRGDVAERRLDEIGIAILERGVEIGGDVLLGLETVGGVPAA